MEDPVRLSDGRPAHARLDPFGSPGPNVPGRQVANRSVTELAEHVKSQVALILFAGACLQSPFGYPLPGVLLEAGGRVQPLAPEHLRLGRDEPAIGVPLRFEGHGRETPNAIPGGEAHLPASGGEAPHRTKPALAAHEASRWRGTVHESMYSARTSSEIRTWRPNRLNSNRRSSISRRGSEARCRAARRSPQSTDNARVPSLVVSCSCSSCVCVAGSDLRSAVSRVIREGASGPGGDCGPRR